MVVESVLGTASEELCRRACFLLDLNFGRAILFHPVPRGNWGFLLGSLEVWKCGSAEVRKCRSIEVSKWFGRKKFEVMGGA